MPNTIVTQKIKLIYFTDPICSTCWLVEPYIYRLIHDFKVLISLDIKMGGLLPSWNEFESPDTSLSKEQFLSNLIHNQSKQYGADMDGDIWIEQPVQSSFPASIAYHAAKLQDTEKANKFLRTIREMLFIEKKDISTENNFKSAAIRCGLNVEQLLRDFENGNAKKGFEADLIEKKKWNITRFPTLIFMNEKGDCIIDKQVLNTITESEILNYWNEIIYKLSEGKIERIEHKTDPIVLLDGFEILSTREMHIMTGTPIPELKERLDI